MEHKRYSEQYTHIINGLNQTVSELQNKLSAHQDTISALKQQKDAQIKLYKTREDKDIEKVIDLENKVKVLDNIDSEQSESVHNTYLIEQDAQNMLIESEDMNDDNEQIEQNDEDVDIAKEHTISILKQQKDAQIKLYKTREDKDIEKVIDLENKVNVLDNIVYKTDQSVQTMNMLNNKCRTSFAKPEYLKKAKQANPRLM
nr:hypothetical protein [Tanacetum cinerariifolium]